MAGFRAEKLHAGRPVGEAQEKVRPVQWLVIRGFRESSVEGSRQIELVVAPSEWLVDCVSKRYAFDLFFAVPGRARSCRLLLRAIDANGKECWRHEQEAALQRRDDGPGSWCVVSGLEARFERPGMHWIEFYLDGAAVGTFPVEVVFASEGEEVLRTSAWEYDCESGTVSGHTISLPYTLPRAETGGASG